LQDSDQDSGGLAAVPLEVTLALERVEYRLDGLAERFEQPRTGKFGFALAGRAQLRDSRIRQSGFGVGATHPMHVSNESLPVPCNGVGQLIPPSLLSARADSAALDQVPTGVDRLLRSVDCPEPSPALAARTSPPPPRPTSCPA
jgi:hypothetical protein